MDVLLVKNSRSIIIIPKSINKELLRLEILPNTILFTKNNDYVTKGTILGELTNTEKQIRTSYQTKIQTFSKTNHTKTQIT